MSATIQGCQRDKKKDQDMFKETASLTIDFESFLLVVKKKMKINRCCKNSIKQCCKEMHGESDKEHSKATTEEIKTEPLVEVH